MTTIKAQIQPAPARRNIWHQAAGLGILALAFLWSQWPTIRDLADIWLRSDEYSSGLLVPFLALYLLWTRRDKFAGVPFRPTWAGLAVLLFAELVRHAGVYFMYSSAERLGLVLGLAGLVLFLAGWRIFRLALPVLLFCLLMIPLPRRLETQITLPLQSGATASAVFCLELLGYNAIREGNVIQIDDTMVAVAEACNGLRMIMAFFVISAVVVVLVRRSGWEKLILFLSALPIALLCNTIRLSVTAIAFTYLQGEDWEKIFHDFGGYAMMPLALALIVLELWILDKMTVSPEPLDGPVDGGILVPRGRS